MISFFVVAFQTEKIVLFPAAYHTFEYKHLWLSIDALTVWLLLFQTITH